MALNCGHSTIKYLLFIFNLLCSLCGIALIVIGAVSLVKLEELREISDEYNIVAPSILLIVFGSIVFVISFFGCCGAIRESYCMTSTYSFFLILLVIAQIVIAVLVFVFVGDVTTAIKKGFERVFQNRDSPVNADLINSIQQNLQCCGKSSFLDYGLSFPQSCCSTGGTAPACVPFARGCLGRLSEFLDSAGNIVAWVSLGVAAVELVGLISACCLANAIRNQQRRSGY
ncbi:23 kDa integral membrane protein-like isoform X1 [Anopheles moucheti]|uniref:23 kDa integral membrane protein-like isoform X1 n=1 Tax=Anopheles moucheti TaxID=186751 RepID=UPI0022F12E9D|nr:23 kDa integral membrane protein-like isoform X1 [Anopheles moucheti]XP_052892364.1 23 kDa integral membrane protein-like isoform X1 [Anopheles moucheti]XP_052892365.1 23 kDa integral membrane protein-like isoform X1 [Anopheles moucheti]